MAAAGGRKLPLYLCLAIVLLLSARMFWVHADVFLIGGDDQLQMDVSRGVGAGEFSRLLAPHNVHWQPIFRLVRLYFDLHFPETWVAFHAVVVAAHVVSVWLLFLLCRRYLSSPWAALAAAGAFGWSTFGLGAFAEKAASFFVLGWPFVLGAMYCLTRLEAGRDWQWIAASFLCQLAAVGIFTGTAAALPGVALGYYWLERAPGSGRGRVLSACAGAALMGGAAWLLFVLPALDLDHHFGSAATSAGALDTAWHAARTTFHAYWVYAARGLRVFHEASVLWFVVPVAVLLAVDRHPRSLRWLAVAAVLTALPLAAIFSVRRVFEVEYTSRYAYQTFTFWAVVTGCAVDAVFRLVGDRRKLRAAALAALAGAGVLYHQAHYRESVHERETFRRDEATRREFWLRWADFFDQAAERNRLAGATMPLPQMIVPENHLRNSYDLRLVFQLCYPAGKQGIVVLPDQGTPEQQLRFRREMEREL